MPEVLSQPVSPRQGTPTVLWIIAVLLAVIAGGLWTRGGDPFSRTANAQVPLAGARGVYAFTGQIDRDQYGLFMLDVDQGTIWCYGLENAGGVRKLKLLAARTWIYDRYLVDFNNLKPDFREIQALVRQQRDDAVTTPSGTKPDASPVAPAPVRSEPQAEPETSPSEPDIQPLLPPEATEPH